MNDVHSLSYTKWNCKYHIVFAPRYRRKVFYEEKRLEVGAILRQLCNWKGVNIIEAEVWVVKNLKLKINYKKVIIKYAIKNHIMNVAVRKERFLNQEK